MPLLEPPRNYGIGMFGCVHTCLRDACMRLAGLPLASVGLTSSQYRQLWRAAAGVERRRQHCPSSMSLPPPFTDCRNTNPSPSPIPLGVLHRLRCDQDRNGLAKIKPKGRLRTAQPPPRPPAPVCTFPLVIYPDCLMDEYSCNVEEDLCDTEDDNGELGTVGETTVLRVGRRRFCDWFRGGPHPKSQRS